MIKIKKVKEKKNNIMKKFVIITTLVFATCLKAVAEENCKDLPGFKKVDKDSVNYIKCITKKSKQVGKKGLKKLNTDSKLTDWIKKKIIK